MAEESRIIILEQKNLKTVSMGIAIPTGSASEIIPGATSVLFTHLQRCTETMDEDQFAEYIDSKGFSTFHQVGRSASYFGLTTPPKHVKEGFSLLEEMLTRPAFEDKIIQAIKQQKMGQLQQMLSNPEQQLTNYTRWDAAYPDDPIGKHPIGTMEGLQQLSADDLEQQRKELFQLNSYFASIGIGIDDRTYENLGIQGFLEQFTGTTLRQPLISEPKTPFRDVVEPSVQKSANAYLGINLRLPYSAEMEGQDRIFEAVLAGGVSSRVFKEIRELRNLSYAPRVSTSRFTGGGLMTTMMDVRLDRAPDALSTSVQIFNDVLFGKIHEDEMQRALKSAQRVAVFVSDSAQLYTAFVLNRLVNGLEYDLVKIAEQLETTAKSDWQEMILKIWKPDNLSFSATGDVNGLSEQWDNYKEELVR